MSDGRRRARAPILLLCKGGRVGRVMNNQHMQMSCPKCRVPMKLRALQHVDDPRKGGVEVEVFECISCGRLMAEAEAEPALH